MSAGILTTCRSAPTAKTFSSARLRLVNRNRVAVVLVLAYLTHAHVIYSFFTALIYSGHGPKGSGKNG